MRMLRGVDFMDNVILALGMDDSSIRMDALSILVYISRNNHFKKTLADNDKLTAALVRQIGWFEG